MVNIIKFKLAKFNLDRAKENLGDLRDKPVMLNNVNLFSVSSNGFEAFKICDDDLEPITGHDDGKRDEIKVVFSFEGGGKAAMSYCPDTDICNFGREMDNLICFQVKNIKTHIERMKSDLDFRLHQYEEHMSK
jgi:hypothetical protein